MEENRQNAEWYPEDDVEPLRESESSFGV
jgi:hypothetical protein